MKDKQALADITVFNKYARFAKDKNRRENWSEIVSRNADMHKTKYPWMAKEIEDVYQKFVHTKKVLPSMRSLQFGGRPILMAENRIFNCAYAPAESTKFFSELMFLLLGGTGMGYSVQRRHTDKLPKIKTPESDEEYKYQVQDSIVGWSDAVKVVCKAFFNAGTLPIFDYRDIREKGAELITTGGQAPGPEPLKVCISQLTELLRGAIGRKLEPIEVHDMACIIADAVLAGGIRRAAMISLFDRDDKAMLTSKSGDWWKTHPARARANNSAVLLRGEVTEAEFYDLMGLIEDSGCGEPGVYWTNNKDWGTNPCCLSGDTLVQTSLGLKKITELIDTPYIANLHGEAHLSKAGFWYTGDKITYTLKTDKGMSIRATGDHKILTKDRGWVELLDLNVGEQVVYSKDAHAYKHSGKDFDLGWLLGEVVGDGGHNPTKYRSYLRFWGDSKEKMAAKAVEIINTSLNGNISVNKENEINKNITVASSDLTSFCSRYIEAGTKTPLPILLTQGKDFLAGFVSGFFDADGSVQGNLVKGVSIRLTQSDLAKLELVQQILLTLGISSKIYQNRVPEGMRMLPDGTGGEKEYYCKTVHELVISNSSFTTFGNTIGFSEPHKQEAFEAVEASRKRKANKDTNYTKVTSIELYGVEPVYDCTIEEVHAFAANGIVVHNCEIALRPYQMCNLTEINAGAIHTQREFNEAASAASFIGTLQAGYTDFHYLNPKWRLACEKEALLGVSMTGIASGTVENLDMEWASQCVIDTNAVVAAKLGINSAARSTCVKPAGTTSLVLGTSSGIHAWHAPYYIRRMRAGKDEALAQYMMKAVPGLVEQDVTKENQVVLSFPQKAPEGATVRTESMMSLLERVKNVSIKWVANGHTSGTNQHNVSCTISVKSDEWEDLAIWMWENRSHYNGISVLPYYGAEAYPQLPFEDITKEQYEAMLPLLEGIDISKVFEEDGESINLAAELACAGGSCEIQF